MMKIGKMAALLMVLGVLSAPVLAAGDKPPQTKPSGASGETAEPAERFWSKSVAIIGACFGAALAAAGGAYGVSRIGKGCIESIARQPEAARDMFAPMVVSAGMVEVGMLFAIVVCLMSLVYAG